MVKAAKENFISLAQSKRVDVCSLEDVFISAHERIRAERRVLFLHFFIVSLLSRRRVPL